MAKIRVYELAKKLNMTNKQLLTKLEVMDIDVKSHMSSLEDEDVDRIKESLFGKKNRVMEVRRGSVIRRRKNKRREEPVKVEKDEESQEAVSEETPTSVQAEESAVASPPDTVASDAVTSDDDLAEAPVASVEDVSEPEVKEEVIEAVQPAPPQADGKARIISVPKTASVTPVEEHEASKDSEVVEPADPDELESADDSTSEAPAAEKTSEEEPEPESPAEAEVSEPERQEPASEETEEAGDVSSEETSESEEEAVSEDAPPGPDTETASVEPKEKKRKKKAKQKKSEPAKIIRMAVPIAALQKEREKPAEATPAGPGRTPQGSQPPAGKDPMGAVPEPKGADVVEKAADAKGKRKKDKKKRGDDDAFVDGGAASRKGFKKRKSVIEGKDLYEKGGRGGKKGRKKDARSKKNQNMKTQITVPKAIKRRVKIDETIELAELAKRMGIKANEMIQKLMGLGVMATVNQTIDYDTASLVAAEFDYEVEKVAMEEDIFISARDKQDSSEDLQPRSPVVTIMGHVDHGKTSLLDVIRKSKVATGEAGGITQHIGAYSVETKSGTITFLDTPGHAAFTSMRSRGAKVTDLVVLVVAADDGVMPQTVEAINHSKAADVPVVVAINKMDKPGADPDRVTRELSEHGLLAEDWGGDVIFAKVSAKAETGIDNLLEMILLQAEVLELKANPDRMATGHVIEARLDAGRGPVATILIEQGTLKSGQAMVAGLHAGRIRAMVGDTGAPVTEAGPSTPVEVVGLNGVPEAGDEFVALESEKDAKQISDHRMQKQRAKELAKKSRANLEKLFENMGADEIKELKLIVKADVHGSIEALNESIMKLAQDEVDIKIVHSGTGAINESDVSLAAVSDAIIIGFNVRPTAKVRAMAKEENVDMRFYDIIYNVINDIKAAITGLMPSTFHEIILGVAEVRDTFVIPNKGTIAGSFVQEGKFIRGQKIRLLRDGVIKCDTILSSLRRFKDDVKEVVQGYECGIGLEKFNDIKIGDVFECYEVEERKASMEQVKE